MAIAPSTSLHQQRDRFFDLALIGIALFDHGERNAVRTENDLRTGRIGESGEGFVYFFDQCLQVRC